LIGIAASYEYAIPKAIIFMSICAGGPASVLLVEKKRILFSEEVLRQQRLLKTGLFRFVAEAKLLFVLTAPLTYYGFVPFLLLDLFLSLYQAACFPIYGIPRASVWTISFSTARTFPVSILSSDSTLLLLIRQRSGRLLS
jgi:hypothetical protein